MFDVFKHYAKVKGVKTTTINAYGGKIKCEGMPISYTVEGFEQLIAQQTVIPAVSLPKVGPDGDRVGATKITPDNIEAIIAHIQGDETYSEEKGKKRVKVAKEEQTA